VEPFRFVDEPFDDCEGISFNGDCRHQAFHSGVEFIFITQQWPSSYCFLLNLSYAPQAAGDKKATLGEELMNLYAILRRDGFTDGPTLEAAAARSTKVGDDMPDDIRWIRSYVLGESSGALGTVCIYQASSEDAIRKHAEAADLAVTEIIPIADTVIVRPDPE
jgi:hypothetical protein